MWEDTSLKRNISVLLCGLMVFIAIVTGGCRALLSARRQAMDIFTLGFYGDGASISSDLAYRAEYAARLCMQAGAFLPEGSTLADDVAAAASGLSLAATTREKFEANVNLTEKLAALRAGLERLGEPPSGSREGRDIFGLFVSLDSRNQTISHDPYNIRAREYNAMLATFPYNLYKKLVRADELELFGE